MTIKVKLGTRMRHKADQICGGFLFTCRSYLLTAGTCKSLWADTDTFSISVIGITIILAPTMVNGMTDSLRV